MIDRSIHSPGSCFCSALFVVVVATGWGCHKAEQIQSYTVPKETAPIAVSDTAPPTTAGATDRMLATILPASQQAWFFKAVGPLAAIDKHEKEILDFFTTIRLDDSGRARWDRPDGWKEDAGTGMRAATLWVPADGKPIEISVTTLGWRGTQQDVLSNVNRWRGQMQLPPVGLDGLADCTREIAAGEAKMTLADLRGRYQPSSMMAPFAGGAAAAGSRAAQDSDGALPAGHPPIDSQGATRPAGPPITQSVANAPKFDVPESWQQRPPSSSMRKAEFVVTDGQQEALVTLMDFPANAPKIADPLDNINRWRGEIGLREITKDGLASAAETVEIDGKSATFAKIVPDASKPEESQVNDATLAAMVPWGDKVWFIKMKGPRDLVAAQEDHFEAFLKSIRFPADGGANNGN